MSSLISCKKFMSTYIHSVCIRGTYNVYKVLFLYGHYHIRVYYFFRLTTATCCGNRVCRLPSRTTSFCAELARCRSCPHPNPSSCPAGSSSARASRRRSPPLSCPLVRTGSTVAACTCFVSSRVRFEVVECLLKISC